MVIFTGLGVIGGLYFSQRIPGKKLKRAFGMFVIILAIGMLYWELASSQ
jgi:putative Ca2+/H+ antiporter (TMEM165/GDT1 family)